MPCDSRISNTVDFSEATDMDAFFAALVSLGAEVEGLNAEKREIRFYDRNGYEGRFRNGRLTVDQAFDINALKVAYATEVVTGAAQRFGWSVKEEAPQAAVAKLW